MKKDSKSETSNLRQKAEELLKKKQSDSDLQLSEFESLKLIHELEVHQIELEMQSEELTSARIISQEVAEKYTQLYDFAPVGYFTLSPVGEIIDVNYSGASMLGKERSLLQNNMFGFFVSDETRSIFNFFFEKVMNNNRKESCEVTLSKNQNLPTYVQLTGITSDNRSHCLLTVFDITERMEAQVKLKENEVILKKINTDKDLLISILAHDLKSPFTGLLGLSKLLTKSVRKFDIDKIELFSNAINKSAQSTYNLLEDLLIWTQSQSGKLTYKPQKLSFNTLCLDIIEMLNPNAKEKNIAINQFFVEEINVFADRDMLKTVLRNLIANAIKFTNHGGSVNISVQPTDLNVTITVSDNGIGLEPEMLNKLFEVSQMLTTKGTANESGSGLGLLLCKNFIEKHGGEISVKSEIGKGSEFIFSLPLSKIW